MTNTLRIVSVTVCNFRSFAGEHHVVFPTGTVLVDGINVETGGSSGAGKSSLVMAIYYALGCSELSRDDVTKWGCDDMWVEVCMDKDGEKLWVRRGDKLRLYSDDKTEIKGSAKDLTRKLGEWIGMDVDLLASITYRPQKTPGKFMSLSDPDKKEFLTRLLALDRFESAIEQTKARIRELEVKKEVTEKTCEGLRARIWGADMEAPPVVTDAEIAAAEARTAAIRTEIGETERKLGAVPSPERPEDPYTQRISAIHTELNRVETARKEIEWLRKSFKECQSEIDAATKNVCPKCNQPWVVSADAVSRLNTKLLDIKQSGKTQKQILDTFASLSDELTRVSAEQSEWWAQIANKNSAIDRAHTELVQRLQVLGKDLQEAEKAYRTVSATRAARTVYEQNIQSLTQQTRTAADDLTAVTEALNVEYDFLGGIDREGFLGYIFEEVLQEIAGEANRVLCSVANVRGVTISFSTERVTLKNTVRKNITPVVTLNGREVPVRTLSGGMRTALDLAVDMAVTEVVSRRTGVRPAWGVWDEPFDGLDPVSKESCLSVLSDYRTTMSMIFIDHTSEVKNGFDNTIRVVYNQGTSTIA